MKDTRIHLSYDQRNRLVPPYDAQLSDAKNWDFDAFADAGASRSTLNDLLEVRQGFSRRRQGFPGHESDPTPPGPLTSASQGRSAWAGWHQARDGETWWHNGQTAGYSFAPSIVPPKKLAVVVLCNTASDQTTPLAEKILELALGIKTSPIEVRKTVKVDPGFWRATWADVLSFVFAITVTLETASSWPRPPANRIGRSPVGDKVFLDKSSYVNFPLKRAMMEVKQTLARNGQICRGFSNTRVYETKK